MLIKQLEEGVAEDRHIVWSYLFLLDRCMCSRLSIEGRCTPSLCFPGLHYAIVGSELIEMEIEPNNTGHYRKKIIKVGEIEWDLPRKKKMQDWSIEQRTQ